MASAQARKRPATMPDAYAQSRDRSGSPDRGDARSFDEDEDNTEHACGCLWRMKKTVAAAVGLFVVGTVLLVVGVPNLRSSDQEEHDRSVAMTVLGSLTFLPGSYACWLLLGAWCGWPGYSYRDIPSYDDD